MASCEVITLMHIHNTYIYIQLVQTFMPVLGHNTYIIMHLQLHGTIHEAFCVNIRNIIVLVSMIACFQKVLNDALITTAY